MSKFMVVPEPHISYTNIDGRKDYIGEIYSYMNEIMQIINEDKDIDTVCFVGDIFNRGFNNIEEYFRWIDWFTFLNDVLTSRGGKIYSVVGNHELSFSKNNPFWRLVAKEHFNTDASWDNKAVMPKGLKDIINVCDVLEYSDKVSIFFCHYDRTDMCKKQVMSHIEEHSDKCRICLSHNYIISNEIMRTLRDGYGRDPMTHFIEHEHIGSMGLYEQFDMVFNGHMHKAYSRFTITRDNDNHKTKLFYLGSIGRTNSDEVNDTDLTRLIPVIDDMGNLEEHYIQLWDRQSTLVDDYDDNKAEKKYDNVRYNDIVNSIVDVSNPVDDLLSSMTDRSMCVALECAVDGIIPQELQKLREDFAKVMLEGK